LTGWFGRRKSKNKADTLPERKLTELEQICGSDKDAYEALRRVMFLDPRKIDVPAKQAVDNAKKAEKEKDMSKARMWYEVAGGVAIYEGDVKKVVEYFGQAERVSGEKYPILNNADRAVTKAQEYYKQHLLSR
jgi:hypothetical protein